VRGLRASLDSAPPLRGVLRLRAACGGATLGMTGRLGLEVEIRLATRSTRTHSDWC